MACDQAIGRTGTAALMNRLATRMEPVNATATCWKRVMDMMKTPCLSGSRTIRP